MPDDHSEVVPLLPIPNRTVKRLCADDSAGSRVKVGHRQALTSPPNPLVPLGAWGFGRYKCETRFCGLQDFQNSCGNPKNCVIIRGSADRS
jgi:hypothetical protein